MSKFPASWEPALQHETIVASGKWHYQNAFPYTAELVRQVWNYTSFDLLELYELPFDDVDFAVSDEGVLYFWRFTGNGRTHYSDSFSTYFRARDHLETYGYQYQIDW